ALRTIENADYGKGSKAEAINRHLTCLNRLDNSDWLPPAISYLARYGAHPNLVLPFLRDLERLAYALFLRRAPVNERIDRYIRILDASDRDQPLDQEDSPLQLSYTEKQRVLEVLEGPLFTQVQLRLPVLLRLEDELAGGAHGHSHLRILSVEQVLPPAQVGEGGWDQLFPDAAARRDLAHQLGNLVLIPRTKNPEAQKWDFERKKQEYLTRGGETPFALSAQILEAPEWTPEVLERRHRQLVGTLAKAWQLR
ncbi:MAG TPA: HNH endonuclease family protein, partial [Gammaproteobacteria bacterium]|nr:HNH endonuclease family protein [Gammaproteobacteria bacterium]